MEMNQTQQLLLGVLAQTFTGKQFDIPEDTDWAALYKESKVQAIAPLFFNSIGEKCTDQGIYMKWKSHSMRALQHNMNVHLQHGMLHQILTKHDIPYCAIKGSASARDYADPLVRAMGDVDFIILESSWEKARQLMEAEGFEASGEEHPLHISLKKGRIEMEMHRDPFGLQGENGKKFRALVPELVENSEEVSCSTVTFRMPNTFGHGLVMLIHAYRHLIDEGIGLRHLYDWAAFISHFSNEEFESIFKARLEELGAWNLAQIFAATAHRYLSVPYQPWMGDVDEQISKMLMLDIFNGGNFGSAESERWTQNRALYSEGYQLSEESRSKQFLRTMNKKAQEDYPCLMRFVILRPFGWMIFAAKYCLRVLTGKRKRIPSNTMKMVEMRKKLYQELRVLDK